MMLLVLQGKDWDAAGHAEPGAWLELAGRVGAIALALVFLLLVVRAVLRHRRYLAKDVLGPTDVERVHEAIREVEARTVGEVLPVVVERSDRHPGALWMAALVLVLLGSALGGAYMPWDHPPLLLVVQLALGAIGYGVARALPDFQRLFVSADRATEMAQEQAFQEFHRHDLQDTEARTGVLLFVSLLEHRVVVLGDEGIDAEVGEEKWKATSDAVLAGIAAGSLADGLVAGIRTAGDVLAEHFPWKEGARNELPDRLIVRRE